MKTAEIASTRFNDGYSCSQAVLSAFSDELNLDYQTGLKIASGFGGGMGRTGETCGAVTGALMALGLKLGGLDAASKEKTYAAFREFAERFETRHLTLKCRDLLGCDISTAEGREQAKEQQLHSQVCTKLVHDAAQLVEDLMREAEDENVAS
jgi:C_GCAxxG_C_C family probable redox protein